jgi:hypothetical protein
MYQYAAERLSEYQYRQLFGLSKQEMLDEPLKDFFCNSLIKRLISDKEIQDSKKLENSSRGSNYGKKH